MNYYDDSAWISQKYIQEHLSMAQIGKIMGMNFGAVRDRLIKFNLPIRTKKEAQVARANRNKKTFHDKEWLYQQYWEANRSIDNIAKPFGVNRQTIYFWLKRHDIQIKTATESRKGHFPSMETREKYRTAQLGRHHPESAKRKIGDAQRGEKNHLWGKRLSSEHIEKLRQASIKNWTRSEFVEKALRQMRKRPTKPEQVISTWFPELHYTGDGKWWRKFPNGKHKNPDFKVKDQPKVIEVFGDYWHRNDDPHILIDLYKQVGLDCLIFWEHEIYGQPDLVKEQVSQFLSS